MSLVHYEPVNLFNRINDEINRNFAGTRTATAANEEYDWTPAVDIRETDDRYILTADIPGVNRNDVEITLEDGVLTVKGSRTTGSEVTRENYRRKERFHGTFARRFSLPDTVDAANISATANDGILEIEIPKQAKPEPKRITVN
jgi:HSP20 family protein